MMMQLGLDELLYKINVEGELEHLKDLIENIEVHDIVLNACRRHKCKKRVAEELVREYLIKEYRHSREFTVERFENEIKKYIGRRVRETN